MTRWKVVVSYKPKHMLDDVLMIDELRELHNHIEHGPDWRLIDAIVITLN